MWPIYFVAAEYFVAYVIVATGVYVCFSVLAGHNKLGKRLFVAVLAFGGGSLAGYVAANVLATLLNTEPQSIDEPNRVLLLIAYVVPGTLGAWASWKVFKPST